MTRSGRHSAGSRQARGGVRDQCGMTLVELLLAMTISVVIGGMIIMGWVAVSGSYANTVKRGEAGDVARFAIDRMVREIRDVEQPPADVSEVAIMRARPFSLVAYTTFNEAGSDSSTTPAPARLVMYRLYSNGELWRYHDANGLGGIGGVDMELEPGFPFGERTTGEGAQLIASNLVNLSTPSTTSPTQLFTYIYYNANGTLARAGSVVGTEKRALIRAVEINMLIDLNPGRSPVYTHLRTTAQLRNTR